MNDRHAAVVQRVLPAAPSEAFTEWIDADALAEWMCPRPAHAINVELDPRVGGRFRIDIEERGAEFYVFGTYLELTPPRLLRFSWGCSTWDDPSVESVVTVTLEPHGSTDTLMIIHHANLPAGQIANHRAGWAAIAEQLGRILQLGHHASSHAAKPLDEH